MQTFPLVSASRHACQTSHPIVNLADKMVPSRTSAKPLIKLSQGDPCVNPTISVPETQVDALLSIVRSGQFNGYPPSVGYDSSREAVATYWATNFVHTEQRRATIHARNVILSSGGSHAILMAITALCNPGDNLLIPSPGFPHYATVCRSYGIEARPYHCDPARNWEIDLEAIQALVDAKTKGLVVNNPSNPCGSNFCRAHVESILRKAEELQLPVISDEIYAEVVLYDEVFTSVADIDTTVPRVILGGTAKNLICPGWRIGWLLLVDRDAVALDWFRGMENVSQLIVGPNSLVQASLHNALFEAPLSHRLHLKKILEEGAAAYQPLQDSVSQTSLCLNAPRAAMYLMVGIDIDAFRDIRNDEDFYNMLLEEENVQVLPGHVFGMPNYFRCFLAAPAEVIREAVTRIVQFCHRHKR